MKVVQVLGNNDVVVVDRPDPEPQGNSVVVKVMASGITGTERRYYENGVPDLGSGDRKNGGHEAAGIVWKSGTSRLVKEGDRVVLFGAYQHCGRCRYCLEGRWIFCQEDTRPIQAASYHAQYVQIRDDFCLPLPGDIDLETGALFTATFGAALRAVRRLQVTRQDSVLVMGQGPLGLAATMVAKSLGARVIAADINEFRLAFASRCGADDLINPQKTPVLEWIASRSGSDGVDVAIECSGSEQGKRDCLESVRRGGARIAFVGVGGALQLDAAQVNQIFLKEALITGSWYCDPSDVAEMAELQRNGLDAGKIITHTFPIAEAGRAFATSFAGSAAKVLIMPW